MLAVLGAICIVVIGPFVIIYLALKAYREQDLVLKKKIKREVAWCSLVWITLTLLYFFLQYLWLNGYLGSI